MTTRMGGIAFTDGSRMKVRDVSFGAAPGDAKYVGGFLVDTDGSLVVTSDTVVDALYRGGLAFRNDGALYVTYTRPGNVYMNSGLPTGDNGAVWATTSSDPGNWSGGYPIGGGGLSGGELLTLDGTFDLNGAEVLDGTKE